MVIDIPERIVLNHPESDIGVALFEIVRTLLKKRSLWLFKALSATRQCFLAGYYADESALTRRGLLRVHLAEYRHAVAVMMRYLRVWRYRDWPVQVLRLAILLPVTIVISITVIPVLQILDHASLRNSKAL